MELILSETENLLNWEESSLTDSFVKQELHILNNYLDSLDNGMWEKNLYENKIRCQSDVGKTRHTLKARTFLVFIGVI